MTEHWTDQATKRPIFDTVIGGRNIFEIAGKARFLMQRIGVPRDRIDALTEAVSTAADYEGAIACIERWFKVER